MPEKTILVTDDSGMIRKIIERELADADYTVIQAKNGVEAMSILEWANPLPDLMTLDIDMPVMGGFEVCEKIRQGAESDDERKKQIARIPIVFVSANDSAETRARGYELEVIDFISKPFEPGLVRKTVAKVLDPEERFEGMSALVVEDSAFVMRIIVKILSRHGLKIHAVPRGDQGLELLRHIQFDIDIVITDYIMPGMSGAEFCRELRKFEQMKQIPVFFVSTVDNTKDIIEFFKAGANDYLQKPFIEEEFRARLVTHLRNRSYVKELERLNRQLQYQAEHDPLTGVYNRGYFQNRLDEFFQHAKGTRGELCCLLIDLDHFKRVNDEYGHAFGDLVLIDFAKILTSFSGDGNVAARYGGEEFALLLPGVQVAEGASLAEELLKATAGYIFSDGNSKLQVTCSIGVAGVQESGAENSDRLLMMADEALYRAKESGRNRREIF